MNALEIIIKKRNGFALSKEELNYLLKEYTKSNIPDYQMAAFTMAVYFQGMDARETAELALAMAETGEVMDLGKIPGIKVDKHSTGGVGDKVTLILMPLLMALGYKVVKMSGRGLGHTGGTIDKLEGITGFSTQLTIEEIKKQTELIGGAIVAQSLNLAPADKKLYALRDVTGTVESIPLIASSIMSKKLAGGADIILLDIKIGKGAFLKNIEEGYQLARIMVDIGKQAGKKTMAVLSGMEQPLGRAVGNNLEVIEAMEVLAGGGPQDVWEVVLTLAATLHQNCSGLSWSNSSRVVKELMESRKPEEIFFSLVKAQGGQLNLGLPLAKRYNVLAKNDCYINGLDALLVGQAVANLGAGRFEIEQPIDQTVGVYLHKKIGDRVRQGDVLAEILAKDKTDYEKVLPILENAYSYSVEKPEEIQLIYERILPS